MPGGHTGLKIAAAGVVDLRLDNYRVSVVTYSALEVCFVF